MENTKLMIPLSLRAVAVIQFVLGVEAAIGMLVHMSRNHFDLNFGVLGIPICFGLLRWSRGWRTCALAFSWIGMLGASVAFVFGLVLRGPMTLRIVGVQVGEVSSVWLSVVAVPLFILMFWQYRVLTRADIRAAFLGSRTEATADVTASST